MYTLLSLNDIRTYQKNHIAPPIDKISLQDLLLFYKNEISIYRYTYLCNYGLKISFTIKKEEICHLLFGTIDKSFSKRSTYIGNTGYNNIENNIVTMNNLPNKILEYAKHRLRNFILLPLLLDKPKVIIFNPKLAPKKGNKYTSTDINANFLLHKDFEKIHLHLFLKSVNRNNTLVPYSFFPDSDDNYIKDQVIFKVIEIKKDILN